MPLVRIPPAAAAALRGTVSQRAQARRAAKSLAERRAWVVDVPRRREEHLANQKRLKRAYVQLQHDESQQAEIE